MEKFRCDRIDRLGTNLSTNLSSRLFPLIQCKVCILYSRYNLYPKKEIAVFVYFSEIHIHIVYMCERKGKCFSLSLNNRESLSRSESRVGFKSIVARKLARVVTSSTKNDGRRSFRLEYRDCYPTSSGNDLLLTPARRQHYFSLNEWPSVAGADLRNAKLCGLYSHGRVITFPWPPYPSCPSLSTVSFSHSPSQPLVPWSCAGNDPSRACNFHPEMARVVQLDNDNKDNNDKNNCHSNEENHGAGSDLAYCERLPLSLSTTWKMIMLLISP